MSIIALWVVTAIVFLAIDMVWLTWLGRGFYVSEIGGLLKEKPDLAAAGAFYALYVTGLLIFVLRPALAGMSGADFRFFSSPLPVDPSSAGKWMPLSSS